MSDESVVGCLLLGSVDALVPVDAELHRLLELVLHGENGSALQRLTEMRETYDDDTRTGLVSINPSLKTRRRQHTMPKQKTNEKNSPHQKESYSPETSS